MSLDVGAPPARFLEQYAKQYHAGAFATPTHKEIAANPSLIDDQRWPSFGHRAVIARKILTRDSRRSDFTGTAFTIPKGARVATHVAHTEGMIPPLSNYDYVMAYAEDRALCQRLEEDGRRVVASRVTAAAEVISCYGPRASGGGRNYAPWDRATVVDIGIQLTANQKIDLATEAMDVQGWDDDFPYYSDGSWSSVSLRGYWPLDPARGVKPSEMPRSWKEANPADLNRTCEWTVLADRLPQLRRVVEEAFGYGGVQTERVRLLKMNAGGKLGRHTDITDRFGGTRDGQIARFHIPLITAPGVRLHTWDLDGVRRSHYLEPFRCYYLDARKPHAVTNDSAVDRIHLVIDAIVDGRLRERLGHCYVAQVQGSATW
jgi:hypothetical protein